MMLYGYKKDERMQIKNVFPFQNATANRKEKKKKQIKQEAISQKEIVFRFRKDIESEKGWRFDLVHEKSRGEGDFC